MGDVKFVRINGRIVPIRGKGSAPEGVSKRYGAKRQTTKPKQIGVAKGALLGGAIGGSLGIERVTKTSFPPVSVTLTGPNAGRVMRDVGPEAVAKVTKSFRMNKVGFKTAAVGALIGAAVGSVKLFKKAKGESRQQLAKRAAGKTGLK